MNEGDEHEQIERGFQQAAQPLGVAPGPVSACTICGRRIEPEAMSITPPVCEYCAWKLRQDEAKRGSSPPPDSAYEMSRRLDQVPLGPRKNEI